MAQMENGLSYNFIVEDNPDILSIDQPYWSDGAIVEPDTSQLNLLHYHNYVEIGICLLGSGNFYIEGLPYSYRRGDCSFIFKNQLHLAQSNIGDNSQWKFMRFDYGYLFKASSFEQYPGLLKGVDEYTVGTGMIYATKNPEITELINSIFLLVEKRKTGVLDPLFNMVLSLYELSRDVLTSNQSVFVVNKRKLIVDLQPVIAYIADNYAKDLTIENMSNIICSSSSTLRRLFRSVMGCSPLSFLHQVRIQVACSLLLKKRISVLEVSMAVGYSSLSSFNRQFRKVMNYSPREWMRSHSHLYEGTGG